jgi:stalled ribosome alternative rescue factor ArfA
MERLFNRLTEIQNQWRQSYVHELEVQANRFIAGLSYGGKVETLLDAKDMGLLIYHSGPETRVLPGFPFAKEIPTGRESVFLEYHHPKGSYHFVGCVDASKQFKLLKLEQSRKGKGYHRVLMMKHGEVFQSVMEKLRVIDIETPIRSTM